VKVNIISRAQLRHLIDCRFLLLLLLLQGLSWSPHNSSLLASAGGTADRTIRIWNVQNFSCLSTTETGSQVESLVLCDYISLPFHFVFAHSLVSSPLLSFPLSLMFLRQVCNLAWSKHADEIVSTHGFSMYQINVWNAPSMEIVGSIFRHRKRVLYLATSPDGDTVATASGDGILHIWPVYPKKEYRHTEKYEQYATIR
jgi:cell division cycle 20-like protein 1, cofactor of APC complex